MVKERTVNGHTLAELKELLEAPFDEELFELNPANYDYLPYEQYLFRMDSVVGCLNYDFKIIQMTMSVIKDRHHFCCTGEITVRDDNGEVVTVKSGVGGADVILKKEDGIPVKPANDSKTAQKDAFKSCCRMLGVGDSQIREKRKEKKQQQRQKNSSSSGSAESVQLYELTITGTFKSIKNGFKAPAVIRETGESVQLVLWQNAIEEIEKYLPIAKFIDAYKNRDLAVYGMRSTFQLKNGGKEEQLVMVRPRCGKE